jgi:Fe2+ transport system protein B
MYIGLHPVADSSQIMLASLGCVISLLFISLGFSDWRASVTLLTEFAAKEVIISTFAILAGDGLQGCLLHFLLCLRCLRLLFFY